MTTMIRQDPRKDPQVRRMVEHMLEAKIEEIEEDLLLMGEDPDQAVVGLWEVLMEALNRYQDESRGW